MYGAAFNPDGTRVATATGKGNTTIWNVSSGRAVMTLSGHANNVNALCYSPDGALLASNAENVKIWMCSQAKSCELYQPGLWRNIQSRWNTPCHG